MHVQGALYDHLQEVRVPAFPSFPSAKYVKFVLYGTFGR